MSLLLSKDESIRLIEELIAADPGGRGVGNLVIPGDLGRAAQLLLDVRSVAIVSGFFIPSAMRPETDGPPGAAALGDALVAVGCDVRFRTDRACAKVFEAGGMTPLDVDCRELSDADCLIAIERPGRAADGCYYTMRGRDISEWTTPLDQAFLDAARQGVPTIGVGDGGNEIGMGKVREQVLRGIPLGETIGCVVPTDRLVVAGVSNWGAWGLVAALSVLSGKLLLPTVEHSRELLQRIVDAGAVDGVTGKQESSVDGLAWSVHAELLTRLRQIAANQAG